MNHTRLTNHTCLQFCDYLRREERSAATVEKYRRDAEAFCRYLGPGEEVTKERVILYKQSLQARYKTSSVNSMLVAVNRLLAYLGRSDCRVRLLRVQRRVFCEKDKELGRDEYLRLLGAARHGGNERLHLLLQTLCSTGIRVGELRYITCEALREGCARVRCKGKERLILLPRPLQKKLRQYCRQRKLSQGSVFVTRSGRPMDRSNIWAEMKRLCAVAEVDPRKVFPHNLRHLFAVTFYRQHRDIVQLADVLGHSNIETTRIYTVSSGREHGRRLDRLGLVV